MLTRRSFFKKAGILTGAAVVAPAVAAKIAEGLDGPQRPNHDVKGKETVESIAWDMGWRPMRLYFK